MSQRRPTTGPVIRQHRYHGRLCGRCLHISWHPEDVAANYCGRCHDWTAGVVVTIPEDTVEAEALNLLARIRALATP